MEESSKLYQTRFPVLTLLIVTGSLVVYLFPVIANQLIYERGQILAGEAWRTIMGVTVHFSLSHLGYNSIILLLAGWLVERENRVRFAILVLATALISSLYFLFFIPGMELYGGLSGIVSAVVVYLCLLKIREVRQGRWVWTGILLLFAAKIGFELIAQQPFFVSYSPNKIHVVPSAHIIGALVAVVLILKPVNSSRASRREIK